MSVRDATQVRPIVVVHSHTHPRPIELSRDILSFEHDKALTEPGTVMFTLKPRDDYMNLVRAGDTINFYTADPWFGIVRQLFGRVASINEEEITEPRAGGSEVTITLRAVDFQQTLADIRLVQAPELVARFVSGKGSAGSLSPDFIAAAGAVNARVFAEVMPTLLGAFGFTYTGTPAQMVAGMLAALMSFGQQCNLPESYRPINTDLISRRRAQLRQRGLDALSPREQDQLNAIQGSNAFLGDDPVMVLRDSLMGGSEDPEQRFKALFKALSEADGLDGNLRGLRALMERMNEKRRGVFDIVDFDFIETLAIDGWGTSLAQLATVGPLLNMVRGCTNPDVNELVFDLRPVADRGLDACMGEGVSSDLAYSYRRDELGINVDGSGHVPSPGRAGIEYVPAVMMREHPFSTVHGIDMSPIALSDDKKTSVGFVPFGPVFAQPAPKRGGDMPGSGRVLYDYSRLDLGVTPLAALSPFVDPRGKAPLKHMDVVTVQHHEVLKRSVTRTEADIVNFLTVIPETVYGASWRFSSKDLVPIYNQTSISRHGLRPRELVTRFNGVGIAKRPVEAASRRQLARWALLVEAWVQHAHEYLSGSLTLAWRPDVRVGYRLDVAHRSESYYVERVRRSWRFGEHATNEVFVTRGQRNDPMPAYVAPEIAGQDLAAMYAHGGDRTEQGRLAAYFTTKTPKEVPVVRGTDRNFIDDAPPPAGAGRDWQGAIEHVGFPPLTRASGVTASGMTNPRVAATERVPDVDGLFPPPSGPDMDIPPEGL